jgi:hypothetical protein
VYFLAYQRRKKENSPTLLDFDIKQHIPENPAAPDIHREKQDKE